MSVNVAVVGATGSVGRELLTILSARGFPVKKLVPIASGKSLGKEVDFGDRETLQVAALEDLDFTEIDLAFFAVSANLAAQFVPLAAAAGAIAIDNSSHFRMDPEVPLVVPEVNPDSLGDCKKKGIVANPNCSTIQLVVALKPLHDAARIKRVVVATYQSVSGSGKKAMDELLSQTRSVYANEPIEPQHFTKQIAFNLIPHIDSFMADGETREEWKMAAEIQKILDPKIRLTATCVRVPVFIGHSEAVNIEFEEAMTAETASDLLRQAHGCVVVDEKEDGGYMTPVESVGDFATFISRIRPDKTVEHGLSLWVVSDNLRKGAALNAVQIAEGLVNRGIIG
jgi:aspartate-semialdehyde dehydrogenase